MSVRYLVSYDLVKNKDYTKLWEALKAIGAVRVLDSEWVVRRAGTTPKGLADYLIQFMDGDDRILVTELSANFAYRHLLTIPAAA